MAGIMFVIAIQPQEGGPLEPLEGVTIVLNGYAGITDLNGSFMFEVDQGVYNYTVSKDGYSSSSGTINLTGDIYIKEIVLGVNGGEWQFSPLLPLIMGGLIIVYFLTRK